MPRTEFWTFTNTQSHLDDEIQGPPGLLQKQLGDMEGEARKIQMELATIRRDRVDLCQKKILNTVDIENDKHSSYENKYLEDIKKNDEVLILRDELNKAKNAADEERFQRKKYEQKLNDLEKKLNNICGLSADGIDTKASKKHNDEMLFLKSQLREKNDEIEELRFSVSEKSEQLQEYRMKYLQAQQQVEEMRRQLDVADFDHKQVSDQIQIEIQRMKFEFQEKLQELAPLPDMLKAAQIQLQETKHLQKLAEENAQQYSAELHRVKEKLVLAVANCNQEKTANFELRNEKKSLSLALEKSEKEIETMNKTLEELRLQNVRLEENLHQEMENQKVLQGTCTEMKNTVNELQMEYSRAVSRSRERAETLRRNLTSQIGEMERLLVQSRAQCCALKKERDEIRQRIQLQVSNLQENLKLAEIRLRSLYEQVNALKNSYAMVLSGDEDELNKIAVVD